MISPTVSETVSCHGTPSRKLFTKPDLPISSQSCVIGMAGVHFLVQVEGCLGLNNLVGCDNLLVEDQLHDT